MLKDFKQFLLRGNVMDLAIAVVIGASFATMVSALVKDIITPLIAAIGGKPNFSNLVFTINNSKFYYGDFINSVISFLIISGVVYFFIVAPLNSLISKARRQKPLDPTTKKCPECLSIIPIDATRCAYCTIELPKKKGR